VSRAGEGAVRLALTLAANGNPKNERRLNHRGTEYTEKTKEKNIRELRCRRIQPVSPLLLFSVSSVPLWFSSFWYSNNHENLP